MAKEEERKTQYREGSLTLAGTVMLGTGVMIGAGIFALTGQMAQMTVIADRRADLPEKGGNQTIRSGGIA